MRTTTLALILCASLFVAQAGIIDYLLNHSSLTNKIYVNHTNGLRIQYNTSLGLKNKKIYIELANLASDLKVDPKANNQNRYAAKVSVNNNTYTLRAQGLAGQQAKSEDSTGKSSMAFSNNGTWTFNGSQGFNAAGKNKIDFRLSTQRVPNSTIGDRFLQNYDGRVYLTANTNRENVSVGNYTFVEGGRLYVDKRVLFSKKNFLNDTTVPALNFSGKAAYNKFRFIAANEKNISTMSKGIAKFAGKSWALASSLNDYVANYSSDTAANVDFASKDLTRMNNEIVADSVTKGNLTFQQGHDNDNGETADTYDWYTRGKYAADIQTKFADKYASQLKLDKNKRYKSFLKGDWKTGFSVSLDDDMKGVVRTAFIANSDMNTPEFNQSAQYGKNGTFNATFKYDTAKFDLKDIVGSTRLDPKAIENLNKRIDNLPQ